MLAYSATNSSLVNPEKASFPATFTLSLNWSLKFLSV